MPNRFFELLRQHFEDGPQVSTIAQGLETVHGQHVAKRRARVLSDCLAKILPTESTVLDVGCGDGEIAWLVGQSRPDLTLRGVDVLVRDETRIPVEPYDGATLPCGDNCYDVVTLVDVLHHCDEPTAVLREAARVARRAVVIKDHTRNGFAAKSTLRLMDWVGNHRYGVALPYNYLSSSEWEATFDDLGLVVEEQYDRLGIYPWPASMLFDRSLHFVARLGTATDDGNQHADDEKNAAYAIA